MAERVAIVGVGQTEFKGRWLEISQQELVNLAVRRALENAQLNIKDIDVVIASNMELFEGIYLVDMWLTEGDGAYLRSGMKVQSGGTTGLTVAITAFDHAATGLFNAVLAVSFQKQDEGSSDSALRSITEDTFFDIGGGSKGAASPIAEMALEMLSRGSVTEEQIAKLRVQEAEYASKNPYAHLRKRLTIEEVMNSRSVVPPLRMFHFCPTSIGACAIVVAPESRAKKISSNPAWVTDWVTFHAAIKSLMGHFGPSSAISPLGPLWAYSLEECSLKLYKRNGITDPRRYFDVVEVYSASTWMEAEWYERLHLCGRNEAGRLIDEGATAADGDIPVNPSGGVVSTNAIGASAMLRIAEVAIQIRGEGGERQLDNVETGLAVSCGGDNYAAAVLLSKSLT